MTAVYEIRQLHLIMKRSSLYSLRASNWTIRLSGGVGPLHDVTFCSYD